jgi:hypothetical protein
MAGDEGVGKSSEAETRPSGAAAPVFISYASEDADTANHICGSLESQGIAGVAAAYAFRGESDEAFKWLDRAYAQKDTLLHAIKYRAEFNKLHNDLRYKAFLKRMNLPE